MKFEKYGNVSPRFDNDPARLVAHYIKLQERRGERLIEPPKPGKPAEDSAV